MDGSVRAGRAAGLSTALAILALLGALALAAFGAASPVAAQEEVVDIVDFTFDPGTLEIAAGTTVTWVNGDDVPHTATGEAFDTGTIEAGESASITFDEAGTFDYICAIHPQMSGTIVVTGGAVEDGDDGGDQAPAPSANLPSTGVGPAVVVGAGATSPLVVLLLVAAGALGLAGVALRRAAC